MLGETVLTQVVLSTVPSRDRCEAVRTLLAEVGDGQGQYSAPHKKPMDISLGDRDFDV